MSHITRVKTELKNLHLIKISLADLGVDFIEESVLSGHLQEEPAELVIRLPNSRHRVSLVRASDGTYSLSGDRSMMNSAAVEELIRKLKQRYAYHMVKDRLSQQGFQLENETIGSQESIHLILRRTN